MKTLLSILTGIVIFISVATAQTIVYTYDDAGNRIRREADTKESEDENDQDETLTNNEIAEGTEILLEMNGMNSTSTDTETSQTNIYTDNLSEQSLKVYPNPTPGNFTMVLTGINTEGSFSFKIINMLGETVFKINDARANVAMIDISDQPKGAYFVKVKAGNKVFTEKIIYQ